MINWTDHPKCSLGTIGDKGYFITLGTASSYAAQLAGDYSSVWHAMSSEHSVSL